MGITASEAAGATVELEFEIRDPDCLFVEVSDREDCRVELEHLSHRSDGLLLEFFAVEGASSDRVLSLVERSPAVDGARVVAEGADADLFEFLVSGHCVTATLADAGAVTHEVSAEEGRGRVVADVPPHVDVRAVVERFRDRHAESELVARREGSRPVPVRTASGAQATLGDRLTDKQLEVLRTAYQQGYFDWPREQTASECAEALGIAQPTFSQHIRAAQATVFGAFFDDAGDGQPRRR